MEYPFVPSKTERRLGWLALALVTVGLVWSLMLAPHDALQKAVTPILYVHVPSSWNTFLAFLVIFVASIRYLRTRDLKFDTVAHAAAGVGIVFNGLSLATGSIWGRYAWGIWWTWDARLTTVAVLFLIYAVYLILRGLIEDEGQRARFSAVLGIIGFVDVPIIHFSVHWWRTLHQPASLLRPDAPRMAPEIALPLLFMSLAFAMLLAYLILTYRRVLEADRAVTRKRMEKVYEPGTA